LRQSRTFHTLADGPKSGVQLKVYECDFDVTGVADFGITLDAILSGKEKIPPQGARVDVAYAGTIKGRVSGSIRGVDYQVIRADGRLDLDTRATVETPDGRRIALSASGVGTPRTGEPMADLFENVRFVTAAVDYAWLHTREIWAVGQVNFATGKIHIEGYQQ
jgi:Protein of unknown function (DUF3237)